MKIFLLVSCLYVGASHAMEKTNLYEDINQRIHAIQATLQNTQNWWALKVKDGKDKKGLKSCNQNALNQFKSFQEIFSQVLKNKDTEIQTLQNALDQNNIQKISQKPEELMSDAEMQQSLANQRK